MTVAHLLHLVHVSQNLLLGFHNTIQFLLRDLEGNRMGGGLASLWSCRAQRGSASPLAAALCLSTYLPRLHRGPCSSPGDLLSQGRDISPLFIENHIKLPVKLLDLQVNTILSFEDLSQLSVTNALKDVIR